MDLAALAGRAGRELLRVARGYSLARAFDLEHPELPRGAVLCGKLVSVCWLLTGQVVYLRAEPVPFGGVTLPFLRGEGVMQAWILVQLLAILTMLCSRFFRAGCALLAATIALLAALDQPLFSNNRAFCAALLAMLALGGNGALARWQVALVYLSAGADKLLAPHWRSGVFLQTFSANLCRTGELWSPGWSRGERLPFTCLLSERLTASPSLAVLASALVIATELALALGYTLNLRYAAQLGVLFHCALFLLTGSTFGMFFYAGVAAALLLCDPARAPAPFDRAWPYFALAVLLAGPWVRPWFAGVLAVGSASWALRAHVLRRAARS